MYSYNLYPDLYSWEDDTQSETQPIYSYTSV